MIDTYVYFVSYEVTFESGVKFVGDCTHFRPNTVTSGEVILDLRNSLINMINELNVGDTVLNVVILNFQLLDSYNKEERDNETILQKWFNNDI